VTGPALFGVLDDGRPVRRVRLGRPGGVELEVLEYGAIVRSLRAPARHGPVETVLGFADLAAYVADASYQGCVVGRCANRIGGARFTIDGERFAVTANEGANCLHGGAPGWNKRLWRFEAAGEDGRIASLAYASPDGEEGFPGAVAACVTFELLEPDALRITWAARTDRPTPVNLSHHFYFNLSGDPRHPVLDHELTVAAQAITPVRPDLIPTGELMPVAGTPFDLRRGRVIGEALAERHPQLVPAGGFDHNWALDAGATPALSLRSPTTGLVLHVTTDQPGVQIYSGQGLGAPFVAHGALVVEPQGFPDAVNQPGFPQVVLRPGKVYRRSATYRFEAGPADGAG
jgi:aldose 1-epimerase